MSTPELQLLISIAGVVIFVGLFLALLFSAIVGLGMARLLYVGGRWCIEKIHQSHTVGNARAIHATGRMVLHH
jgi:hypothetical protein